MSELPPEHPIWDVWNQVKSAFPGPTANWEDEPPAIWAYAIDGLTNDQLRNGVHNLTRDAREFPPSAAQFRDMCLMSYEWEHAALKHDFTGYAQLEDLTGKEAKMAERKSMMAALREQTGL